MRFLFVYRGPYDATDRPLRRVEITAASASEAWIVFKLANRNWMTHPFCAVSRLPKVRQLRPNPLLDSAMA